MGFASQDGASDGLLLELGADVVDDADLSGAPRYLAVEKLSAHEHERELLFTGKRVKLKITKIIPSGASEDHRTELSVLNKIQKLLRNGTPKWKKGEIELFQKYRGWRESMYVSVDLEAFLCDL